MSPARSGPNYRLLPSLRACGQAPDRDSLAEPFIRNYYRYADHMYACYQHQQQHRSIRSLSFQFDLYASGEYSRLLEREWQDSIDPLE